MNKTCVCVCDRKKLQIISIMVIVLFPTVPIITLLSTMKENQEHDTGASRETSGPFEGIPTPEKRPDDVTPAT